MNLQEFKKLKEELKVTESYIEEIFGLVVYSVKCPMCGGSISQFDYLQFFDLDTKSIEQKLNCPSCQSNITKVDGVYSTGISDPGDEKEIIEHYFYLIYYRIRELYKDKVSCNINPYEDDFIYSELIVDLCIVLEVFVSKLVFKKFQDNLVKEESLIRHKIENLKPNIKAYIDLLEIIGIRDAKKNLDILKPIWGIRNTIIHQGYKANFVDFAKSYITVGNILVFLENQNIK